MKTLIELRESDFETSIGGEDFLPILDFGEESEYYITYGHIPFEEMVEYAKQHLLYIGEDPEDKEIYSLEDVSWRWAIAYDSDYNDDGDFTLRWKEIGPKTDGAFPITLLSIW